MTESFLCPRREELGDPSLFKLPESDRWVEHDGHRVCSHCGSAHPDDVMTAILNKAELTPTDKSYKGYVVLPHSNPEESSLISVTNFEQAGYVKVTPEEAEAHGWGSSRTGPMFGLWRKNGPTTKAKFYFQHFEEKHKDLLIELVNSKAINFARPGHFYVLPYFCGRAKPETV